MNALKKTALGLSIVALTAFGARAQSGNQLAFNDNAKTGVVDGKHLTNYTSAIPGDAGDAAHHTRKSGTIGMFVYGPPGSEEALEAKANELFNTYKPHVDKMIVTFKPDPRFKEILVGVANAGTARQGVYAADAMIEGYEKVLGAYGIDVSTTTASIASINREP